jgi:acylpyruvate hydrolase
VISDKFLSTESLEMNKLAFTLEKNGEVVQSGNISDMIFSIDELIAHVSQFMTLKTGDLIYTGTPSGVGPIEIGDVLVGKINDEEMFRTEIK